MMQRAESGRPGLAAGLAGVLLAAPAALAAEAPPGFTREGGSAPAAEPTFRARVVDVRMVDASGSTCVVLEAAAEEDELLAARPFVDIFVGPSEGAAIARAMQGVKTPRPMTHALLAAALESLGAGIERLTVTKLEEKVFHGELLLRVEGGEAVKLDCRPSDGMALSVAAEAPIFVSEDVLRQAGRAGAPAKPEEDERDEEDWDDEGDESGEEGRDDGFDAMRPAGPAPGAT
jgi:bifunctional DNase/RNase